MTQAAESPVAGGEQVYHLKEQETLARSVPWWLLIPWLIGGVTGGDFFITNTFIVTQAGSLTHWAYFASTAFIILMSLVYWELISAFPYSGGEYVYMSRAFGSFVGYIVFFLYAFNFIFWVPLNLSVTGSYLKYIFQTDIPVELLSVAFAVVLHLVVFRGILFSTAVQAVMSVLVILGTSLILFAPMLSGPAEFLSRAAVNLAPPEAALGIPGNALAALAFGGLTITYMVGFEIVPLLAEEMATSRRRMGYVQTMGSLGMGLLQMLCALGMVAIIPAVKWAGIAGSEVNIPQAAMDVAPNLVSPGVVLVILCATILSAFATAITAITGFSRATYVLARDHRLPGVFAQLHPKYRTPVACIALSLAFGIFGSFQRWVVDYAFALVMATMFMYILIPIAHIILRRKEPGIERPVRTPFYPWINIVVCVWAAYMFSYQLGAVPISVWYFLGAVIVVGLVLWFLYNRRRKALLEGTDFHYGLRV